MMADARVVSNELVSIAGRQGNTLTPMQVLKLAYIAHGFRLGVFGVPLIDNKIEAWKFGPVIPILYHSIKDRRDKPVRKVEVNGLEQLTDDEREFLEDVYDAYKDFSGIDLSNLTHQRGTPWHQVYRPDRVHIRIPDDLIQDHYQELASGADA